MKKKWFMICWVAGVVALASVRMSGAHCQIPCGIYDDAARVATMLEDAATVEKARRQMAELAKRGDVQSLNQRVRWIVNKEDHAQKIIDAISDYFLTQRVKATQADYTERLKRHHAVIVAAMKAKQNSDPMYAKALMNAIKRIKGYYSGHAH